MDLNEGVSVASFTKVHVDAVEQDEETELKNDPFIEEAEAEGPALDEYDGTGTEEGGTEAGESEEDESQEDES